MLNFVLNNILFTMALCCLLVPIIPWDNLLKESTSLVASHYDNLENSLYSYQDCYRQLNNTSCEQAYDGVTSSSLLLRLMSSQKQDVTIGLFDDNNLNDFELFGNLELIATKMLLNGLSYG